MDYEKKYKEALEKAKRLYGEGTITECLCHIFPELKEFVDEKIRKLLIRLFTSNTNEKFDDVSTEEIIAWLEKQGNADNIEPKIEPKFHKGEWVVWQDKFYKVNYNGCGYELIDQNGLSTSLEYGTIDENAHLWTIKNVKEGDVVVCKGNIKNSNGIKYERICLFNNLDNAFFTLTKISNFIEEYDIDVNIDYPDNTIPATKEQKEILFMAMKEAGYEWDAEKKELKKLSQQEVTKKSDKEEDCIEIPFGAKDSEFIGDTYFIPEGCYAVIVGDEVVIKKGERKPAWSEEDEHRAEDTIYFLDTAKKHYASTVELDACIDWLKSLKQRIGG